MYSQCSSLGVNSPHKQASTPKTFCASSALSSSGIGFSAYTFESGKNLDQEGFEQMLRPFVHKHGQDVINDIFIGLEAYANLTVFPDDVSIIMFEHRGAVQN